MVSVVFLVGSGARAGRKPGRVCVNALSTATNPAVSASMSVSVLDLLLN
ncbi:hypothetical protein [Streptomyces sp. NPDC052811]